MRSCHFVGGDVEQCSFVFFTFFGNCAHFELTGRHDMTFAVDWALKAICLELGGLLKHENTAHRGKNWVAPYYGCSLSPGKAAQISHALHWDKKMI